MYGHCVSRFQPTFHQIGLVKKRYAPKTHIHIFKSLLWIIDYPRTTSKKGTLYISTQFPDFISSLRMDDSKKRLK